MVECSLCGKVFKSITASHLKAHGFTVAEYRNQFPAASIYLKDRYSMSGDPSGIIKCAICGKELFGATCCKSHRHDAVLDEVGLWCLQRYERPDDSVRANESDPHLLYSVASYRWSKTTRARIEHLFV